MNDPVPNKSPDDYIVINDDRQHRAFGVSFRDADEVANSDISVIVERDGKTEKPRLLGAFQMGGPLTPFAWSPLGRRLLFAPYVEMQLDDGTQILAQAALFFSPSLTSTSQHGGPLNLVYIKVETC